MGLKRIVWDYPLALVVTDQKVYEKIVTLMVEEDMQGKGKFTINTGEVVITIPLDKIQNVVDGRSCSKD